jgi:hypothetical protein
MRQRSRLYSIALARILPTAYARTANPQKHTVTLACAHSRTHASTHTSVCSGSRRSLRPKLHAPPRCAASTTASSHSATGKRRHARDNMQDGTGNGQEPTCDRERASCNVQRDEMRRGAGDRQRTPWNRGHGGGQQKSDNVRRRTCDMQQRKGTQTRSNGQRAADDHWKTCNRQLTACNMQRGKCNRRHAACIRQLPDNMRRAAGNMQRTTTSCNATCSMQHATGNVESRKDH